MFLFFVVRVCIKLMYDYVQVTQYNKYRNNNITFSYSF